MTSRISVARVGSSVCRRSAATIPEIPHIGSGSLEDGVFDRFFDGVAVDVFPEPELEHQQGPEAMGVIAAAGPVLLPERRERRTRDDAATVEARREQDL